MKTVKLGINISFDTFGKWQVADMNRVADFESTDINLDDLWKILGKATDRDGAHALLKKAAEIFDTVGFAGWLDRDVGGDFSVMETAWKSTWRISWRSVWRCTSWMSESWLVLFEPSWISKSTRMFSPTAWERRISSSRCETSRFAGVVR
jgi:hypothetical protein